MAEFDHIKDTIFTRDEVIAFIRADRLSPSRAVPEGWVCVPREPTKEMLNTWALKMPAAVFTEPEARNRVLGWSAVDAIWRDMIAAAPPAGALTVLPADALRAEMRRLGYSDTAINAMGASTTMMQRAIDAATVLAKTNPAVEGGEAQKAVASPELTETELRHYLAVCLERMDRARRILTDGKPTPTCNWGVLDTADIRDGLAAIAASPSPAAAQGLAMRPCLEHQGRVFTFNAVSCAPMRSACPGCNPELFDLTDDPQL